MRGADILSVLSESLKEALKAALHEYGAGTVLLILCIIALFLRHERLWRSLVTDKNKEIARIAAERDRLQDHILTRRLGTGLDDEGNPQPQKGRET